VIDADLSSGGEKCLGYFPTLEGSGVRYEGDYRTLFLSFGFEAITTKEDRVKLMQAILHYFDIYIGETELQATSYELQVFPNPTSGATRFQYRVPVCSLQFAVCNQVSLSIYDIHGRKIRTLFEGEQAPGDYIVLFDGSDLPAGVYFVRLQIGVDVEPQKLVIY
jgi:hypothetical protein